MSCCDTRACSQEALSLARAWLSLPWQGLREPGDLQITPGSEFLSSYIQKQTLFIFFRTIEFAEEKVYSTTHEWNTRQLVTQTVDPSSHCHHSLLLLGTSLSLGALSGNGCSTRDAGPNYFLLIKASSPKAHILVKRSPVWQPTTERWSSLPEARSLWADLTSKSAWQGSPQLFHHSKSPVLWTGMRREQIDTAICAIYRSPT